MTNLKAEFRAALAERHEVRRIAVADRQFSTDGTIKSLFRCDDGATIESVYIPGDEAPDHLHLHPGRVSGEVRVLPHRYQRLQAESQALGDPVAGGSRDGRGEKGLASR